MTGQEYIVNVIRTEAPITQPLVDRMVDRVRLLHAMMGMCTEVGEIQDQIKKHVFYGKDLNGTNLVEELGDLLWYVGLMCDELEISLEEVMERNINKLKSRYPNKFTEGDALNRDLDKEQDALLGRLENK